jgi:hypothetical protein
MSLRKTVKLDEPYAVFTNDRAGWEWRVLKVNQPKKTPYSASVYATWLVAAKSPNTFGSWEYGDTYAIEIIRNGRIKGATEEFIAYLQDPAFADVGI